MSLQLVPDDGLHIDGIIDAGSQEQTWWTQIQTRSPVSAPLEISLGGSFNIESREGNLNIDITATEVITQLNLRVRIALTESEIFFQAPNGVQWHNQTMRDIIPYPYGIPIDIDIGQTVSLSEPFLCPGLLDPANCNLVIWVQSEANQEGLQAAGVKLDDLFPTSIDNEFSDIPERISLSQNYPNPFNATTTIAYEVAERNHVTLELFDISGRLVMVLVDGIKDRGSYSVSLGSSELAGGVYFYRLHAGEAKIARKMVLIK